MQSASRLTARRINHRPRAQDSTYQHTGASGRDGSGAQAVQAQAQVQYVSTLFLILKWTIKGQLDEFRIEKVTNQIDRAPKLIRHLLDTIFGQVSFCHPSKNRNRVAAYYTDCIQAQGGAAQEASLARTETDSYGRPSK